MTNWWPKFDNKIVASAGGWLGATPGAACQCLVSSCVMELLWNVLVCSLLHLSPHG